MKKNHTPQTRGDNKTKGTPEKLQGQILPICLSIAKLFIELYQYYELRQEGVGYIDLLQIAIAAIKLWKAIKKVDSKKIRNFIFNKN